MNHSKTTKNDAKEVFRQCGTCSRTFFHLLNREFGQNKEAEEHAADPLAGGIMKKGHQCGMLWGAALAVGAESFRRCDDHEEAIALAIRATQHLVASFSNRTNTVNCREIIGYDLDSFWGMTKFMLKNTLIGMNNSTCFNLAEDWAPEAIQAAKDGLSHEQTDLHQQAVSCASEVAGKMGASDEERVIVAGLAGGIGLSGNACGALSAAIWMNMLEWGREHPGESAFGNPIAKKTLEAFCSATGDELLCSRLSGKRFETIEEHSEFIQSGGCKKLIDTLARS